MSTKITVNGVSYESIEAMPADVRRLYEETLAQFPDLADRDRDGIPEIVQGRVGPLKYTTKLIVNGTKYGSVASMPPEVRQAYEEAMRRAASSTKPAAKKGEIKMSFQVTGPGFNFSKSLGGHSANRPRAEHAASEPISGGAPAPTAIEPAPVEGRLRMALVVGACAAVALALWLLTRAR